MMKTEKVSARTYDYQEDTIGSGSDVKLVEGADFTIGTQAATTLRSGTTQIIGLAFQVSATADAIKLYGRAKETALTLQ